MNSEKSHMLFSGHEAESAIVDNSTITYANKSRL